MVKAINYKNDDIHKALKKLKDGSNDREMELIELISTVYESLKDTKEKAVDKVKETGATVNESVHSHPWYYIGGAALIGLLAGLCFRR